MGNRLFHTLYCNLRKELSTKEGQKAKAAENLQDQIEEEVGL